MHRSLTLLIHAIMPPSPYSCLALTAIPCSPSSAHLSEHTHEVELVCNVNVGRGFLAGIMGVINATWPHRDNVLINQVRAVREHGVGSMEGSTYSVWCVYRQPGSPSARIGAKGPGCKVIC